MTSTEDLLNQVINLPPTLLILISTVLAFILYYVIFKKKSLPPGPTGLPILGYWPFFRNDKCVVQLDTLKNKYGDIFSFTSTGYLYICLGSIKAVREVHINKADCFTERISPYTLMVDFFKEGVFSSNGEAWKVLRKFFLQALRERVQTSLKDQAITSLQESVNSTIEFLKSKEGEPADLIELLTVKCIAYLRVTLFGESGMSEEQILELNKLYGIVIAGMTPKNLLVTGPIGEYVIFPLTPSFKSSMYNHKKIEAILTKLIEEQFATYDETNMRSIIDDFLYEKKKRTKDNDPSAKYFTEETTLRGYHIPKGTITLVNMYSAHKDPDAYEDPEKFDPSRYYSFEGKRKPELPITFGMGKRSCLGEGFIMLQAFLFVTSLIKHFKFTFAEGTESKTTKTFDAMSFEELRVCANYRH